MRLIDKDSLISFLHTIYDPCMTPQDNLDFRTMFRQIITDIENEPEVMAFENPVTKDIQVIEKDCIYDEEETIENCTVQLLKNSKTGAVSVGWWRNE